jgi:hypothetical protein
MNDEGVGTQEESGYGIICYITHICSSTVRKATKIEIIKYDCRGFNNLSYTIHLR